MANLTSLNSLIKIKQRYKLIVVVVAFAVTLLIIIGLLIDAKPKKSKAPKTPKLTSVVDETFSESSVDSAMQAQQRELIALKDKLSKLNKTIEDLHATQKTLKAKEENKPKSTIENTALKTQNEERFLANSTAANESPVNPKTQELWQQMQLRQIAQKPRLKHINIISFRNPKRKKIINKLNPYNYVPSNTSVRAIILGGADADASVNGQSKNNGVMLFKLLDNGALPNGATSRLRGCRVSGNAYGDISSERAFATLYKLSCVHPNKPIIDKEVTGWVFFNGKVGVKGVPLMRDNKVMQWAGVSGALSGIASAAQYAQSAQSISAIGATSVVPSQNIGPYAAYGGATKAADVLSQYYVKRAEQYHPVIQVGSGNIVTIVFKDGFYLEDEKKEANTSLPKSSLKPTKAKTPNFEVPEEVLSQIEGSNAFAAKGVEP